MLPPPADADVELCGLEVAAGTCSNNRLRVVGLGVTSLDASPLLEVVEPATAAAKPAAAVGEGVGKGDGDPSAAPPGLDTSSPPPELRCSRRLLMAEAGEWVGGNDTGVDSVMARSEGSMHLTARRREPAGMASLRATEADAAAYRASSDKRGLFTAED